MSLDLTIPSSIPILNGTNYQEWEHMMHFLLQTKGLYQYIKPGYIHPPATNALENQYIEIGVRSAITPVAAVAATATSPAVTAVAVDHQLSHNKW